MMTDNEASSADDLTALSEPQAPSGNWSRFAQFRRSRPFWGCLILALGGYFVMQPMFGGSMSMLMHMGVGGATVYILGGGMIAAAAVAFFAPAQRYFPAIMAMVFSVASLPLANLGGWIMGMVLGIVGSGMVFAWTPFSEKELAKQAEKQARRDAKRAGRPDKQD